MASVTVSVINVRERRVSRVCDQCKERAASVTVSVINVRKERKVRHVCHSDTDNNAFMQTQV